MPTSATVDDVRLIFETPMSDSQLQSFLSTAIELVDERLALVGFPAARMKSIACFMAAHLASAITPSTSRERVGREYEFERTGDFGEGLKSTVYGQTVLILDTSGTLAAGLGSKRLRLTKVSPSGDPD